MKSITVNDESQCPNEATSQQLEAMKSEITQARGRIKDLEQCLAESGTDDPAIAKRRMDEFQKREIESAVTIGKLKYRIQELENIIALSGDPIELATTKDALKARSDELNAARSALDKVTNELSKSEGAKAFITSALHEVSAQRDYWKAKHAEVERNYDGYREYWRRAAPMMAKAADDFSAASKSEPLSPERIAAEKMAGDL